MQRRSRRCHHVRHRLHRHGGRLRVRLGRVLWHLLFAFDERVTVFAPRHWRRRHVCHHQRLRQRRVRARSQRAHGSRPARRRHEYHRHLFHRHHRLLDRLDHISSGVEKLLLLRGVWHLFRLPLPNHLLHRVFGVGRKAQVSKQGGLFLLPRLPAGRVLRVLQAGEDEEVTASEILGPRSRRHARQLFDQDCRPRHLLRHHRRGHRRRDEDRSRRRRGRFHPRRFVPEDVHFGDQRLVHHVRRRRATLRQGYPRFTSRRLGPPRGDGGVQE